MRKICILIFLFNCANIYIFAQEQCNVFKLYDNTIAKQYNVYTFFTYPSCESCFSNLKSSIEAVLMNKLENNFDFVLFLENNNQEEANSLKTDKKLNCTVIADPLALYYSNYKIGKTNSFIVLDNKGKLIIKGSFDNNSFSEFLKNEVNNNNLSNQNSKSTGNSIELIYNCKPYKTASSLLVINSKSEKDLYIMSQANPELLICHNNEIIKKVKISFGSKKIMNPSVQNISWRITDSILFIPVGCLEFNAEKNKYEYVNKYFEYNTRDSSINEIIINSLTSKELKSWEGMRLVVANDLNQGYFVFNLFSNVKKDTKIDKFESLKLYSSLNRTGIPEKEFGRFDPIYSKYFIYPFFKPNICFSGQNLYIIQNCTNKIQEYNNLMDSIQTIQLEDSPNLRKINQSMPEAPSKDNMADFYNQVSSIDYLYRDNSSGSFLIVYRNKTFPLGITNMFDPKVKTQTFGSIFGKNGNFVKDIEFNMKNPTVANFNKNEIKLLNTNDGILQIQTIKTN